MFHRRYALLKHPPLSYAKGSGTKTEDWNIFVELAVLNKLDGSPYTCNRPEVSEQNIDLKRFTNFPNAPFRWSALNRAVPSTEPNSPSKLRKPRLSAHAVYSSPLLNDEGWKSDRPKLGLDEIRCCSHTFLPPVGIRRRSIIKDLTLVTIRINLIPPGISQLLHAAFMKIGAASHSHHENRIRCSFQLSRSKEMSALIKGFPPSLKRTVWGSSRSADFPCFNSGMFDSAFKFRYETKWNLPRVYSC